MTPLEQILIRRVEAGGPITIADYMAECLMHPEHGYYSTRDPFGTGGDFTTAPEISQMFGELVGLALAQSWLDRGAPSPFVLAELGPGRGTLMADILRATRAVPGFAEAARVVLLEASPTLRARQAEVLGPGVSWVDSLDDLPDAALFLVANEFFDALPIRQFRRDGPAWRERMLHVASGALQLGEGPPMHVADLENRLADTRDGDLVELCPTGRAIAAQIGARLDSFGGCAILIDYGDQRSLGDTLQALRDHAFDDPLAAPGEADLTAHVDFGELARAAGVRSFGPVGQGVWLERLGITARAQALAGTLSGPALEAHIAAHRRLTHPQEMGTLFKVCALCTDDAPPPGFDR